MAISLMLFNIFNNNDLVMNQQSSARIQWLVQSPGLTIPNSLCGILFKGWEHQHVTASQTD